MVNVVALGWTEPVRVDPRRRDDIIGELGRQAGENVITAALEHLAGVIAATDAAVGCDDRDRACMLSQQLARLAWQVGLVTLATVAMDLDLCLERQDPTSTEAVRARLIRVGNRSLTQLWEPPAAG